MHLLNFSTDSLSNSPLCRCGPLSRTWCMRYEAKHSYFKHLARVLGNFKNIPKTLADRHQQYMCYNMSDPTRYLKYHLEYSSGKEMAIYGSIDIFYIGRPVKVKELHYSDSLLRFATEDTALQRYALASLKVLRQPIYTEVLFQSSVMSY